jgi:hypothetical protein
MEANGSMGTTSEIKKVTTIIPSRVMIRVTRRRRMYRAIYLTVQKL